jgi:uncharacterized membrane protein YccC
VTPRPRRARLDRSLGCLLAVALGLVGLFGLLACLLLGGLVPLLGP